jgi:hypothetical protein
MLIILLISPRIYKDGGGEVQNPLNQNLGSNFLRAADFESRFVFSIIITNLDTKSTAFKDFKPKFWFKGL